MAKRGVTNDCYRPAVVDRLIVGAKAAQLIVKEPVTMIIEH